MKIKQAKIWLNLGWEITRRKWTNNKYLKKFKYTPFIEINTNGKYEKYKPSKEDLKAKDWIFYNEQSGNILFNYKTK